MKKFVVVHRKDLNNVGDMASNPLQYFLKSDEYDTVDISEYTATSIPDNTHVIVGGGGLLENQFFGHLVSDVLLSHDLKNLTNIPKEIWKLSTAVNKEIRDEFFSKLNPLVQEYSNKINNDNSKRILWGAGHNVDGVKKSKGHLEYSTYLQRYDMVGIRDHNQMYEWLPCASCMHPALQKSYPIKNDIIWFEHKKQLIKSADFGDLPIPRFVNSGNNIEQTIELLGSANTIFTNSYHGAYWGTLLKKKVIVVDPWSSKFFGFKHQPAFLSKGETLDQAIEKAPVYHTALDECKTKTQNFWNRVTEITR